MRTTIHTMAIAAAAIALPAAAIAAPSDVLETLRPKIQTVVTEFDRIPADRKSQLEEVALAVRSRVKEGKESPITFICTHNSRRSHLSQIWAQTAAAYYGVPGVKTFSGGTEATACNHRTVRALRRAGFSIANSTPGEDNPRYLVQYGEDAPPVEAFSKVYHRDGNPKSDFIAVMTCSHADVTCPIVDGSFARIAVPYIDPKVSDGTPEEDATYDERCHQIAREMFYLMSKVAP